MLFNEIKNCRDGSYFDIFFLVCNGKLLEVFKNRLCEIFFSMLEILWEFFLLKFYLLNFNIFINFNEY